MMYSNGFCMVKYYYYCYLDISDGTRTLCGLYMYAAYCTFMYLIKIDVVPVEEVRCIAD